MTEVNEKNILEILENRFNKNIFRHPNINWDDVLKKLKNNKEKIFSLIEMEKTGGEVDLVKYDLNKNEYIFFDCSKETPIGRRSLCYDSKALEKRKVNKPKDSVMNMANKMKVSILDEEEYRFLQTLGEFDLKTSSWINTSEEIRKLGGALFCDRRYNKVFVYHNGADSYYSVRGFRASLKV